MESQFLNRAIHDIKVQQTLNRGSNTILGSSFSHFENGATPRSLSISCIGTRQKQHHQAYLQVESWRKEVHGSQNYT